MEKFIEILQDLILDSGIKSLRELERNTGIGSSQWSKYLKGQVPNISTAIKISDYFDVSLDYLFGLSSDKSHKGYGAKNLTLLITRYKKALDDNKTTNWLFCKKYNLSESNWRHWKNGQEPKLETLAVIADKLSTSIDYLVGRF